MTWASPYPENDLSSILRIRTQTELDRFCDEALKHKRLAFDIETQGLNAHKHEPLLLAFTLPVKESGKTVVIRRHGLDMRGVKAVLESRNSLKFIHNAMFEWVMLYARLGIEINRFYCTFLAEKLINVGRVQGFGLADLEYRYFGIERPNKKELQMSFVDTPEHPVPVDAEFTDEQWEYAAEDTTPLEAIFEKQNPQLAEMGLVDRMQMELKLLPVLARMQLEGVDVDEEKWRARLIDLEMRAKALEPKVKAVLTPIMQTHYRRRFALAQGNYVKTVKEEAPALLAEYRQGPMLNKTKKARAEFDAQFGTVITGERDLVDIGAVPRTVMNAIHRAMRAEADAESQRKGEKVLALVDEQKKLYDFLQVLDDEGINLRSNGQVQDAYKLVGIDLGVTGKEDWELRMAWDYEAQDWERSADEEALDAALKYMGDHPKFAALKQATIDFKEVKVLNKQRSTYGEKMLDLRDEGTRRLHYEIKQYGAESGRMSAANPNIMNIPSIGEPSVYRTFFIAPKDHVMIKTDFSQIELRIAAEISKDPALVDAYLNDKDIHALTACEVGGMSYEDFLDRLEQGDKWAKDKRKGAKPINFGIPYGISAFTIAIREKMPLKEAEELVEAHKRRYSLLHQVLDDLGKFAQVNLYAKTLAGRIRWFTKPAEDQDPREIRRQWGSIYRQGRNHPIQGTNAEMTKEALILLDERFEPYRLRKAGSFPKPAIGNEVATPLYPVHDEIVSVVPRKYADICAEIQTNTMVECGERYVKVVPVKCDTSVGYSWAA